MLRPPASALLSIVLVTSVGALERSEAGPPALLCLGRPVTIAGTPGPDNIQGTAGDDVITGLSGSDTINGLGGDDVICGKVGRDVIDGGPGNDVLSGDAGRDRLLGRSGDDEMYGGGVFDRLIGGPGNDSIAGGAARDKIDGNAGSDILRGDDGDDLINGGPDTDSCDGGAGTNTITNCEEPPNEFGLQLVEHFPADVTFNAPVAIAPVPGQQDSYLVLERAGLIFRIDQGVKQQIGDISQAVSLEGEGGLWNLVFSPGFAEDNQQFYIYYGFDADPTEVTDVAGQLSRFDLGVAPLEQSEVPIFTVSDLAGAPVTNTHNGGGLAFGTDGHLYLGVGDGGAIENVEQDPNESGQDNTNLAGTILRLDVESVENDGDLIPTDNPFAELAGCADGCDEIFAYGFRNPWRLDFDAPTGLLWVSDVGHSSFEEVDVVVAGGNYGWDIMEGPICFPAEEPENCDTTGLLPPVFSYPHAFGERGSISGGFVYHGEEIPALTDSYVYGDLRTGVIRATLASDPFSTHVVLDTTLSIVSFGRDWDGEVLVVDLAEFRGGGPSRIYKLVPLS